jgi:hypothetical protein
VNLGCKISVFLILAFVSAIQAQFNFSENEKKIQNAILDLKVAEIPSHPAHQSNGIINWLNAYQSFVYFQTTSNIVSIDSILNEIEKQQQIIEGLKPSSPYYNYCLADIYLMNCYLNFENGDLLRSLANFWSAKKCISENRKQYPDFSLNQKHQLIVMVIDKWVNENVFGKKNETTGFWQSNFQNEWKLALSSQKEESVTYREMELVGHLLQLIFGNISAGNETWVVYPNSVFSSKGPLEAYVSAMHFNKMEQYPQTMQVLTYADSQAYNQRFNALNLAYGTSLLNQMSSLATDYLQRFIRNQKNANQVTYAQLKLTWFYLINQRVQKADSLIAIMKQTPKAFIWDDEQALYEVKHSDLWKPEILKSRLLFDGGDYSHSIETLLALKNSVGTYNQSQKLEYSYRLARAYHKSGNPTSAIPFYQMVVGSELDSEFYYPAYAAFYLGEIFENSNDRNNAIKYYTICTHLDSPIYKTSIHKKAKRAKESIEK